ncbi:hypothetical protein OESDEN_01717 [Oesophagostomum dentatum]|uniref:Uncharacterized protein n=1 Tax=Oesophagostomum dentatum TaxID=61180 RepID=A0A0B1TM27_OESDE|nr:hypothetical protein OESDEN_01717 [Oesophagostomum dentatum]
MTRYIVPSVAISAIYSAFRSYFDPSSSSAFGIRTVEEAVASLNANVNALEALRFIQHIKPDNSLICSLSPTALGVLALRGSELCQHVPVTKYEFDVDDVTFSALLANVRWLFCFTHCCLSADVTTDSLD